MKARVYQLAKELGRSSKELIDILAEFGIDVKNHMSTLSEDQVMRARAVLMPRATDEPPKKKTPPKRIPPRRIAPMPPPVEADDDDDDTPTEAPADEPSEPAARPPVAPRAGTVRAVPPVRPGRPAPKPAADEPAAEAPADEPAAPSQPAAAQAADMPAASAPETPTDETDSADTPAQPAASDDPPPARPRVAPRPGPARPGTPPPRPGAVPPSGRRMVPPRVPPVAPRRPVPGAGARPIPGGGSITARRPAVRPGGRPGGPPARPGRPGGRPTGVGRIGRPVAPPSPDMQKPGARGRGRGGPGRGGGGPRRPQYGGGGRSGGRSKSRLKRRELTESTVDLSSRTSVEIHVPTTVRDFSAETGIRVPTILTKLMAVGLMANINSALSQDFVELLATEFDFADKLVVKQTEAAEDKLMAEFEVEDAAEDLQLRAPIIAFLGHVDHGKTSLLDAIRGSNVQADEAGGITQHISAFKVTTADGKKVVFLDTPGHKAFTEMRARGADVTDVVVLVVAADDGVMPQTKEAISHAKAADVKIVVAINKVDAPGANIDKVKTELSAEGLQPEDWGGDTSCVETSAITKQGIDDLVEILALESELMDLRANPDRRAQGHVLEASVSGGKGVLTTLLVKNGTLRVGDYVLAGQATGRVRAMMDDRGRTIEVAPPATPVEVLGLNDAPEAGEAFIAVEDEKAAKDVVAERLSKKRALTASKPPSSIDELMKGISDKQVKEVKVVLKADVQGSVEVLRKELSDLAADEVKVTVIHAQVGGVNESDVLLANASGAIIIGFNVVADERARQAAEAHGISMSFYSVIYKITEDLRALMEGMLEPEEKEEIQGHVEIRKVFKISRFGNIAGCYVTDGLINRNSRIRLARDGIVIHTGTLDSLKREKNDVREVKGGLECGIKLAGYDDIKEGDVLEAFTTVQVKRTLG